jgi:hypothetical protein
MIGTPVPGTAAACASAPEGGTIQPLERTCIKELLMTPKMQGLRELTDLELDQVFGGTITEVHRTPGNGNQVPGGGNGLDTQNENPAGHAPNGHNK